jgi:hypothetical protein
VWQELQLSSGILGLTAVAYKNCLDHINIRLSHGPNIKKLIGFGGAEHDAKTYECLVLVRLEQITTLIYTDSSVASTFSNLRSAAKHTLWHKLLVLCKQFPALRHELETNLSAACPTCGLVAYIGSDRRHGLRISVRLLRFGASSVSSISNCQHTVFGKGVHDQWYRADALLCSCQSCLWPQI